MWSAFLYDYCFATAAEAAPLQYLAPFTGVLLVNFFAISVACFSYL